MLNWNRGEKSVLYSRNHFLFITEWQNIYGTSHVNVLTANKNGQYFIESFTLITPKLICRSANKQKHAIIM